MTRDEPGMVLAVLGLTTASVLFHFERERALRLPGPVRVEPDHVVSGCVLLVTLAGLCAWWALAWWRAR